MTEQEQKEIIVRNDLNIENWPIFGTSNLRATERVFSREIELPDGSKLEQKVYVKGTLRILAMKVLYLSLESFNLAGNPVNDCVEFTFWEQIEKLGRSHSFRTLKQIKGAFEDLFSTTIKFVNSWTDANGEKNKTTEYFRIFEELKIAEKTNGQKVLFAKSSFKFDDKIIQNIIQNKCKPISFTKILSLEHDISMLLYRRIDLKMYNQKYYHRKTKDLFEDLGLASYEKPSKRKQLLEPVADELRGIELSTGKLIEIKFERTIDGEDWNICFRKEPFEQKEPSEENNIEDEEKIKELETLLARKFPLATPEQIKNKFDEMVMEIAKDKNIRNPIAVASYRIKNTV